MKKSKFIIYIFLVIVIVICVDLLITWVIENRMHSYYNQKIEYAKSNSCQSQIAIIGASRAAHHYIPEIFEDSLNLSTFNYGIDGRNIYVHYAILKLLIDNKNQKPNMVILDLSNVDVYNTPGFNKERLNILYPYCSDTTIYNILSDLLDKTELLSIKSLGLVRHNSSILQYAKNMIYNSPIKDKGYESLTNIWGKELESQHYEPHDIDSTKTKYLEKFIKECTQANIQLILVTSPSYNIQQDNEWSNLISQLAKEGNVPYYNFDNDSLFLSHREWFSDPTHLNDKGAQDFSKIIIQELKK